MEPHRHIYLTPQSEPHSGRIKVQTVHLWLWSGKVTRIGFVGRRHVVKLVLKASIFMRQWSPYIYYSICVSFQLMENTQATSRYTFYALCHFILFQSVLLGTNNIYIYIVEIEAKKLHYYYYYCCWCSGWLTG